MILSGVMFVVDVRHLSPNAQLLRDVQTYTTLQLQNMLDVVGAREYVPARERVTVAYFNLLQA